jgi:hypothetical protein
MGHHNEILYVEAKNFTVAEAASSAVIMRQAIDMFSHDIQGDYWVGSGFFAPLMSRGSAETYIEAEENRSKVCNSGVVVPVVSDDNVVITTKKVKVELDGEMIRKLQSQAWGSGWELFQMMYAVHGVHLTHAVLGKAPKPRRAVAVATEGNTKTMYSVGYVVRNQFTVVVDGFESQAAARAEAIRLVNSDAPKEVQFTDLEVRAYLTREGNERAIVKVSRPLTETAEVEVLLTFARPVIGAKPAAYVVGFDVHT